MTIYSLANLMPHAWFADRQWMLLLVVAAVAAFVLIKGADWLVEGASGLAFRFGMPKVIVGATIVSLGTTSPEAAVSVLAAWSGNPGLALGNAVGSVIADAALIFGLGCLLVTLPADRYVLNRQGWVQFGSAVLLAIICYGVYALQGEQAILGRSIGLLLLGLLFAYLWISTRWAKVHPSGEPFQGSGEEHEEVEVDIEAVAQKPLHILLGFGLLGLVMVVLGADVGVQSVGEVALQWGVPQVVIAATLVAIGTSLPELVVGITSIRKGHPEILVGNVIGADILNVLFVVGASAAAAKLPIIDPSALRPAIFLQLHLPAMLVTLLLFRVYIFMAVRKGHFSRWMGVPLLVLYVVYSVAGFVLA